MCSLEDVIDFGFVGSGISIFFVYFCVYDSEVRDIFEFWGEFFICFSKFGYDVLVIKLFFYFFRSSYLFFSGGD